MENNDRAKEYFEHVIERYVCGDIRALLEKVQDKAGPLLNSVVNGIDILGGIIFDFKGANGWGNSRQRSIDFMADHMGLHPKVAELLYKLTRCGMTHEGVPKLGIRFFLDSLYTPERECLYRDEANDVYVNVTALAHSYLNTVSDISKDDLQYVPECEPQEEDIIREALPFITGDYAAIKQELDENTTPKMQSSLSARTQSTCQAPPQPEVG